MDRNAKMIALLLVSAVVMTALLMWGVPVIGGGLTAAAIAVGVQNFTAIQPITGSTPFLPVFLGLLVVLAIHDQIMPFAKKILGLKKE